MAAGGNISGKHSVIFSRMCVILEDEGKQAELNNEIENLMKRPEFDLYFTSHETIPQEQLDALPTGLTFLRRGKELRDFIKNTSSKGEVVIICGAVDKDMHVAASTKSFLIAAGWVNLEPGVVKYGIPAPTPSKMRAIIQIVANQTSWYYSCTFKDPVPTKVVSLCLANTYGNITDDEKDMAKAFQAILKNGDNNPVIKQALICHLMAAIAHDPEFKDVQDWAVAPSSSTNLPQIMEELKERVRYMMNGRNGEAIFSRHTQTTKSRFDNRNYRESDNYCQKHFQSIIVSENYKKLEERVVCVFDDYLTQGNTFETLRNLLVKCKVSKIILVSIGKFKRNDENVYKQKSFSISGDVSKKGFEAELESVAEHNCNIDVNAQRSLQCLKELAKHLE